MTGKLIFFPIVSSEVGYKIYLMNFLFKMYLSGSKSIWSKKYRPQISQINIIHLIVNYALNSVDKQNIGKDKKTNQI